VDIDPAKAKALDDRLRQEAAETGYFLNPDREWTLRLCQGLLVNEARYDYRACPCRLATGKKDDDLDIICPCDYRDADVNDFGACYCGLYVSEAVYRGEREFTPIKERRPAIRPRHTEVAPTEGISLYRCKVCGYLCAREKPPGLCPICKAKAERFEAFVMPVLAIPKN
jgi:ferredoxin-thioredoxin reductase catalytic subunit